MSRVSRLAAFATAITFVTAGCGRDAPEPTADDVATTTRSARRTLLIAPPEVRTVLVAERDPTGRVVMRHRPAVVRKNDRGQYEVTVLREDNE